MLFNFSEVFDILIMTFAIGYIFMDYFNHRKYSTPDEYIDSVMKLKSGFDWERLMFSSMIVAPAIILHEVGHKFSALFFGFEATFHAAYPFLLLGIILKLARVPFIFFIPAYVAISGFGSTTEFAFTAFAGPLVNLILWLSCAGILKYSTKLKKKTSYSLALSAKVNMFLFIFNMLPIPGFDGFKVWSVVFGII